MNMNTPIIDRGPSGTSGVVGIKPTVESISRSGIVPIAHSQGYGGCEQQDW
jgi:Asp-tRNA(Asn)/Glu-tRNA(Gln) amidotransferase A subunit family amidase